MIHSLFPRHLSMAMFAFITLAKPASADLHRYQSVALARSGSLVAAVELVDHAEQATEPHGRVVVRAVETGAIVKEFDPCSTCSYAGLTFGRDSQLAFIATDDHAGTATLYAGDYGAMLAITTLQGVANTPRWSPNGGNIALLATLGAHKKTGATEAGAAQTGEIGTQEDEQRITLVNLATRETRQISPADTFVYEYDWTPDGHGFVGTAAKGNGDNNWWVATLNIFDIATGKSREIAAPKTQMNLPRVSPDGHSVAYIGGLMSDLGSVGGDLFTVPIAGGEPTNLTPRFNGSFNGLNWAKNKLIASALTGGMMSVLSLDSEREAQPTLLWSQESAASAGDGDIVFDVSGRHMALVSEDFTHGPQIMAGPIAAPTVITHDNETKPSALRAQSLSWQSDGFTVQGWLLGPRLPATGSKHPLVVIVHGGPGAAAQPHYIPTDNYYSRSSSFYSAITRDLVAQGYYVLMPNPRGSFGQGEAFTKANVRDFGGGDLRDILAGIDAAAKAAPIDPERIGLYGHSYGGFMAMWGVTHSQRFKAAVAGAGVANWMSYYGENGIDQWMVPFFGATAYNDPAIYRAASPIESIRAAKTPTLIYVGERDVECPAPQSIEFWHGLHTFGVPTSLVIYEGEGHHFNAPEHIKDIRQRILAWFQHYL